MLIPINQIIPDPDQPRKTFDEEVIKEIASSLNSYGVISPIKVRPCGNNQYMIIVGELRYRASKQRGDKEIECIIQDTTDQQVREQQFIENLQRSDIPDEELGEAFVKYCKEYECSQRELAKRIGKSHRYVQGRISVAEKLSSALHKVISTKSGRETLPYSVKRELASIPNQKRQEEIAQPFIEGEIATKHASKVAEIARKEPERPVKEIVTEVLTPTIEKLIEPTPEEKETLEKAKPGKTVMDNFFELSWLADKLYHGLGELEQFPPAGKAVLAPALQYLTPRIQETLEKMGIQTIEGEAKLIEEE